MKILVLVLSLFSISACSIIIPSGWQDCNLYWSKTCGDYCFRSGGNVANCWVESKWLKEYNGACDSSNDWKIYFEGCVERHRHRHHRCTDDLPSNGNDSNRFYRPRHIPLNTDVSSTVVNNIRIAVSNDDHHRSRHHDRDNSNLNLDWRRHGGDRCSHHDLRNIYSRRARSCVQLKTATRCESSLWTWGDYVNCKCTSTISFCN